MQVLNSMPHLIPVESDDLDELFSENLRAKMMSGQKRRPGMLNTLLAILPEIMSSSALYILQSS